jgi:hypothetical protein
MDLLTPALRAALRANATGRDRDRDPIPLVKLFNPRGSATWLATALAADEDTLFGLADLGCGCPELGSFSLTALQSVRLPLGLGIERDLAFDTRAPLSVWARAALRTGSIRRAETILSRTRRASADPLPPPANDGG